MSLRSVLLETGAEGRWTGTPGRRAVVCVNGGTSAEQPGTWSASVEWLVRSLAPRLEGLAYLEVRYRIKSWRRLDDCIEDAKAAVDAARAAGAEELLLLGFSMGGAVAVRSAGDGVEAVVGVNPWLPRQLELDTLVGRRLAIVHGSLDAPLPGIPGVKPSISRAAAQRARDVGADVEYHVLTGGLHPIALRAPGGRLVAMPRAQAYADFVARELERFCA